MRLRGVLACCAGLALLLGSASPPQVKAHSEPLPTVAQLQGWAGAHYVNTLINLIPPDPPAPPPPPPPPTAREARDQGVLIVVSKASQSMYVFRRGEVWGSSAVSTGKRGHETPDGVFPILQKKVHHRSNLYDNAPMPYMQRLTWDGVALHAGRVPGYPASHGCIRVPWDFAKKLYGITQFDSTIVVVTDEPVASEHAALNSVH